MSQNENLLFAHDLAQSMGLTEYEVVGYAPTTTTVLATGIPSAAAVEWEEAAKSSDAMPFVPARNTSHGGDPSKTA